MNNKIWVIKLFFNFMLLLTGAVYITYFFHDKFDNNSLKNKEYLIKNYNPKIIFSGDSRAERQLNVEEATNLLKLKHGDIVNIAISAGDPIMLNNLIDKYPNKFKDATVVLSISANSLNDNSKLFGHFGESMISKLSYLEQINTFVPGYKDTLLRYYYHNAKKHIEKILNIKKSNNQFESSFGFYGIDKELNTDNITLDELRQTSWYFNYDDNGMKYQFINNSLKEIKQKVKKLYIYTSGYAPAYLDMIHNSDLIKYELSFQNTIKEICKINNVKYKNYFQVDAFKDSYFYDVAHLNREGSEIFTKIVLKDFNIK